MAMTKVVATERDSNSRVNGLASSASVLCTGALSHSATRRNRGSFIMSSALLLAACSTPAVKDRVVEIRVPVAVQPIKPEQVPPLPSPLPPRPDSLSAAADVLLGKVCEFVAYALKADPLLRVSAGQSPSEPPLFPECER